MKNFLVLFVVLLSTLFLTNANAQTWRYFGETEVASAFFDVDNIKIVQDLHTGRTVNIKTKWIRTDKLLDFSDYGSKRFKDITESSIKRISDNSLPLYYSKVNKDKSLSFFSVISVLILEEAANYPVGPPPVLTADYDIECSLKEIKANTSTLYDNDGEITDFEQNSSDWVDIPDDSNSYNLSKMVCPEGMVF